MFSGLGGGDWELSGRLWRFGQCEFDESTRELKVQGRVVELESKPLDVLYHLLQHAGEVVTKEELLEAVWPGTSVVDGSLATAVSKLRKALGEEESAMVLTVPRIGYRLTAPVNCTRLAPPKPPTKVFQAGDPVPGRDQWQMVRRLDGSGEVWLAEHPKTREKRVFKFAFDGVHLTGLKREVTLSRLLKETLGERPDFVRVLEWNFDSSPFYLESEYCGANLKEWAEVEGGLGAVSLQQRLEVLIAIAEAVHAAHEVGVLHRDLKPANVLMTATAGGGVQVKVADFGSASLSEPGRLHDLGITNLGFTQTKAGDSESITGTLMYLAPEVLAGQPSTVSADVYALGVMLYQLVVGDYRKPLSPGWEAGVADPLIREDIADAACGDAGRRIGSAGILIDRLRTLEARRSKRTELDLARLRALEAERRLAEAKARRPWIAAAMIALTLGMGVSLLLYRKVSAERDRANQQTSIAAAVNRFLADDLIGRSNPFQSGTSSETLVEALKQALPNIDRQFRDTPEVAAQLHQTIARAMDTRTDWGGSRQEYKRAGELFVQSQGADSQDAMIVELQRAAMEARTYEKGSLERARGILAVEERKVAGVKRPKPELPLWLATARGMVALIANDGKTAADQFQIAYDLSGKIAGFDERARLTLQQRLAFARIRLGDGAAAERLFEGLIAAFTRIEGAESPSALRVRMNLAQAYMIQGKHKQVLEVTGPLYPAYAATFGEDHEMTLQLMTTRAQSEGSLGLWDDAIRDDMAVYERAVKKQGAQSFFAVATLADAALAQCRGGRTAEGERNARKATETAFKGFGARSGLAGGSAYTLATCLIGLDRLDEATKLLDGIDIGATAQLAGDKDWSANVDLARAELASRRADYDLARQHLAKAATVFTKTGVEPFQRRAVEALAARLEERRVASK